MADSSGASGHLGIRVESILGISNLLISVVPFGLVDTDIAFSSPV